MTLGSGPVMYRPDDALLAGVCAKLASRLSWNVWAVRALFVAGLFIMPLWVGAAYLVLALLMGLLLSEADSKSAPPGGMTSSKLSERGRRIADLEAKFSELEKGRR